MLSMISAVLSFLGLTAPAGALAVGDEAPRITAPDQNGAQVDLAAVYAKGPTLVYFYPKADTPGCTAQACSLRDAFPDFTGGGVQVVGVSGDSVEGQKKFADKYKLPFTLLADSEGNVAKAFGVPAVMGIAKRQSFIVVDGKIAVVIESAKTGDHAAEVKAALSSLGLSKKS
ncbi:MAG: peroxiredoxin [Chthoniobacterales bacterium]